MLNQKSETPYLLPLNSLGENFYIPIRGEVLCRFGALNSSFFQFFFAGKVIFPSGSKRAGGAAALGHGVLQTTSSSSVGDRIHRPDWIAVLC
jgi:hypothetical protein